MLRKLFFFSFFPLLFSSCAQKGYESKNAADSASQTYQWAPSDAPANASPRGWSNSGANNAPAPYHNGTTTYTLNGNLATSTFSDSKESSTEEYASIVENDFQSPKQAPLSTFSVDVDRASYANVRRILNEGRLPEPGAVRIEEMLNYFEYEYQQPKDGRPFSVATEVGICPWNAEHRLVHIGLQGQKLSVEQLPPSNLVFLLDVSGSMDEPNKLPLLKDAFRLLVEQMRPADRVSIVVYAGASGVVLPSTSGADKGKILDALNRLQAGGSTAGGEGIVKAYEVAQQNFIKGGNNRVILATDGDFNVGVSSEDGLVRLIEEKRKSNVFLSVIGFGSGNLKDKKMEQLADHGNGNYAYIDAFDEAKKVLGTEIGGTLITIAKDVKIQVEFNPAKVRAYRLIGYENRMLAAQDFNDDTKDAGEIGAGHSVTALYEIVPVGAKTELPTIDALKYQPTTANSAGVQTNEMLTVKLRYKKPDGDKSAYFDTPVENRITATNNNFKFSSAVAAFGLLLRNSKYKGAANYDLAIRLAKEGKGYDLNGYRAECIGLMEKAKALSNIN